MEMGIDPAWTHAVLVSKVLGYCDVRRLGEKIMWEGGIGMWLLFM